MSSSYKSKASSTILGAEKMLNSDILNDQNFKTNISKLLDHFKWIDFMYLNQSIL